MEDCNTSLDFLADLPLYQSEKPFMVLRDVQHQKTHEGAPLTNVKFESQLVVIRDMRADAARHTLATSGFEAIEHTSRHLQFSSLDLMVQYKKETEELLTQKLGADYVICFDCKLRKNGITEGVVDLKDPLKYEILPKGLHVDSTFETSPLIIERWLSEDEKRRFIKPSNRFRIINTWRPLVPRIEDRPLAMCDFRSVKSQDMAAVDRIFPHMKNENYLFRYNERQRFYWLPNQTSEELILMVQYDTKPGGHAKYCPHVSFDNPIARRGAPLRKSVETRSIVINCGEV